MRPMVRTLLILGVFACGSACNAAPATAPSTRPAAEPAKELALRDIEGADRRPLDCGKAKASVVFFLAHDCPISNSYAPEINRICAVYGGAEKFTFSIVHPYADLTAAEAKKHAKEYGFTAPVFVDAEHKLCDRVGATVTP